KQRAEQAAFQFRRFALLLPGGSPIFEKRGKIGHEHFPFGSSAELHAIFEALIAKYEILVNVGPPSVTPESPGCRVRFQQLPVRITSVEPLHPGGVASRCWDRFSPLPCTGRLPVP